MEVFTVIPQPGWEATEVENSRSHLARMVRGHEWCLVLGIGVMLQRATHTALSFLNESFVTLLAHHFQGSPLVRCATQGKTRFQ